MNLNFLAHLIKKKIKIKIVDKKKRNKSAMKIDNNDLGKGMATLATKAELKAEQDTLLKR